MKESDHGGNDHHLKRSIPAGTCDLFGEEARQRQDVIDIIRRVYELHGFEPLYTPILEHSVVFSGHHGEGEKLLFNLGDSANKQLVLRYDLTVPLARVVSMYPDLPRPFKRYQIATVFRDDNVDTSHHREFTQCDGDVVGAQSLTADAEILCLAHDGLSKLGFKKFSIRINHRAIIKGIAARAGIDTRDGVLQIQRALDYADKVSKDGLRGVVADLRQRDLPENVISTILPVLEIKGNVTESLAQLRELLQAEPNALLGIDQLNEILSYADPGVIADVAIDLTLARGADYYTGFILEGIIDEIPVGAVLGGGRYDNLVEAFNAPREPAVGMAFGLNRILTAMKQLEMNRQNGSQNKAIVICLNHNQAAKALRLARKLRTMRIETDLCCEFSDAEKGLDYAKKRGFKVAICADGNISMWKVHETSGPSGLNSVVLGVLKSMPKA
jgi:histidyl-tRNA synthetase